ncbi:hypothetical protein [Bacillus cereus]|uniref:hypothetical protein n=1 Tax=Bacillus cereus TaxID=1396 RepID=UPI00027ABB8D|nr:hypothetical protein [Bacillus cereus]EJS77932.1 hypothetical protein ICY_00785 [Bacillus cereus BAG2X1-3]
METTTHIATWSKEEGYDKDTLVRQNDPNAITRREAKQGKKSKSQLEVELRQLTKEARSNYGANNYIIINEASEDAPNWKILHQPPKGSGGVGDPDIMDRWQR